MASYSRAHTLFTSANNGVDTRSLSNQIWTSSIITTLFTGMGSSTDTNTGNITYLFNFISDLSGAEETELDVIITAHSGKAPAISSLALTLDAAYKRIDESASDARARYITDGVGQSATYLAKEANARKFKDDAYPEGSIDSYPWVKAEKNASAAGSGQVASDTLIAKADGWVTIGASIEELRIEYKRLCKEEHDGSGDESIIDSLSFKCKALLDAQ